MPRIYKPAGPSANKAETPAIETKTPPPATKDGKAETKKDNGDGR